MVLAIIEPVFAGVLVSMLNRYVLSGQCCGWLQSSCERQEEVIKEGADEEGISSTTTTVSDASMHVHCHRVAQFLWNPIQVSLAIALLVADPLNHPSPSLCRGYVSSPPHGGATTRAQSQTPVIPAVVPEAGPLLIPPIAISTVINVGPGEPQHEGPSLKEPRLGIF